MISPSQLNRVMPSASPEWTEPLNSAMARFNINTKQREAMFLAQAAFESRELTRLQEDLDYRADRLLVVWPKHFVNLNEAEKYAHNPELLANLVYANRLGNGDFISGDGWRYRGRGPFQITGADAYRAYGRATGDPGILLTPDRLLTKPVGALSAAWFFSSRGCNELADTSDIGAVTERVNGPAKEGLSYREAYFAKATGVLA